MTSNEVFHETWVNCLNQQTEVPTVDVKAFEHSFLRLHPDMLDFAFQT